MRPHSMATRSFGLIPFLLVAAFATPTALPYSILTHEAIIDSAWDTSIQKMLHTRFPKATAEEIEAARAYAYGGCIIQDMGYYPLSSRLFSDLTHYVRSGDFIAALIRESRDLNEYAFALGALAHHAADDNGHRLATNVSVPILYPKLGRKFGPHVTYWDNPVSHARTEFGFDVLQIGQGRYASQKYRDLIGFQVSKPVLERAFLDTYGLELKDVFSNLDLAIGTYRYTISSILPGMTRVAWRLKKDDIVKQNPSATEKEFLYTVSRATYEKQWGNQYTRPGVGTRVLTYVIRVVPKWGPLRALTFRTPTPEVEKLFMASFNASVENYRSLLTQVAAGRVRIANDNFDTGEPTQRGKYLGADEAYAKLLDKLAHKRFVGIKADLRADLLGFYKGVDQSDSERLTKKQEAEIAKLMDELSQLRDAGL